MIMDMDSGDIDINHQHTHRYNIYPTFLYIFNNGCDLGNIPNIIIDSWYVHHSQENGW